MGWNLKLFFIILVYIAGFSTAIYFLAPDPQTTNVRIEQTDDHGFKFESYADKNQVDVCSELKKQQFIRIYNLGLHKCVEVGKNGILRLNEYIHEKNEQKEFSSTG